MSKHDDDTRQIENNVDFALNMCDGAIKLANDIEVNIQKPILDGNANGDRVIFPPSTAPSTMTIWFKPSQLQ